MRDIQPEQHPLNHPPHSILSTGLFWLVLGPILGPSYLAAVVDDNLRASRKLPRKVNSASGWIDCWGRGAKIGLFVGGFLATVLALYLAPFLGMRALYIVQLIAFLGLSLGGAIGFVCGGHDEPCGPEIVQPKDCSS
ncbi:MAG: hypothetical protein JWN70_6864 [Planctomycetaceae bacterium]|nr:hypothetical protein [Planctomycetaceae bacterium]